MTSKGTWLLLLLSAVSPAVLGNIIMRPSCTTGWFYHKSNCYGYFRKLRTWSDAELECQSYGTGSHLASVLDEKEARTIAQYISGYQRSQPVWIGLHDPQKRQKWRWIDGSSYLYGTWTDKSLGGNKYCAEISSSRQFLTWSNDECNKLRHFLCKYRP